MNIDKEKKVYLVTGSSSGLGKSFVRAIIERGDYVVATARNKATLMDLKEQIMVLELDVTNKGQIRQVVQTVINAWGAH